MIVQVSYERVFNLGNFENHRISATASVDESGVALAYAACRGAVEEQHAQFIAEHKAEQTRQHTGWQRPKGPVDTIRYHEDDEDLPL